MALSAAEILANPKAQTSALLLTGTIGGIQMADPIVASLALPKAGAALNMDATELALAASISTLCLAATVVLIGALAERHGRRTLLLAALALAVAGDLVTMAAPTSLVFMLGRALAGIGVGGALACSYAYVRVVSPDHRLGHALGVWAAVSGIAAVPLCLVGAGLANLDWRLAFVVVPIASIACALLTRRLLPRTPPAEDRRQLYGVTLAGLGVVGLLYGVSQAATRIDQPKVWLPIAAGVILLVVAAIVGTHSERPSYPVHVFRDPAMLVAVLAGAMWNLVLAVAVLQSSNLWQYVDGIAPFSVSILQLPANLAVAVSSFLTGRLMTRRIDLRILMVAGFAVAAAGFAVMSVSSGNAVAVWFNVGLVGAGFGAGAAGCVQSQVLLDAAPPRYLSTIAASRTTFGQMGYAIGLAGSVVVTSLLAISRLEASSGVSADAAREQLNQWLASPHAASDEGPVADAYRDAFAQGMVGWSMLTVIAAIVCAALLTLAGRARQPGQQEAAPAPV